MSLKLRAEDFIFDHSNWMKTKHTHLSTPTAPVFDHMSLKLSQAAVCLPQITLHFCWSTRASPLGSDLYGNSSVVEPINSYHKYLKWQSATRAGCDLLLWPFSVFPFVSFSLLYLFVTRLKGWKKEITLLLWVTQTVNGWEWVMLWSF